MAEKAPRDELGLSAAEEGDIHALEVFLRFVQRELLSLSIWSGQPKEIQQRLSALRGETQETADFISGWDACVKHAVQKAAEVIDNA